MTKKESDIDEPFPNKHQGRIIDGFPIIKAIVGKVEKNEITKEKEIIAILDTGANRSMIKQSIADELELKPTLNNQNLKTGGGIIVVDYYDIGLCLPDIMNNQFLDIATMSTNKIENYPADMLIGWDLLRYCSFIYEGHKNKYELEFKGQ